MNSQDPVDTRLQDTSPAAAWSLFDRAVLGSYHKLSKKHLPRYLDEFAFRFNNRENPYLFRDTILRLVEAKALTYEKLTA